jgi:hypothetical protein
MAPPPAKPASRADTVEGPFYDTRNSVLAVTGGTGAYRNVRGEMEIEYHTAAGDCVDFVFHLIG